MRLSTRWADVQLQKQKLISAQNAMELDSLRRQLNPHFLFNTLNTIYALIDIDSDTAKEAVHKLSGMLRQMLYENEPAVALSREAELLTNYTELMRLRMGSGEKNLEVVIDIDSGKDAEVPSLLFIPLIENAFKYGLQARPQHPIRIRLAAALSSGAAAIGYSGNRSSPPCGYWTGNFAILRDTLCPAVLSENMFMDNVADLAFLKSPRSVEILAALHAKVLAEIIPDI